MSDEEALTDLLADLFRTGQVTQIGPDDRLIFKFDRVLTDRETVEVRQRIATMLGSDIRFLIVGAGVDVSVIRQVVQQESQ